MTNKCAKCKDASEDLRILWMACFYDMNELGIPFKEKTIYSPSGEHAYNFYTLTVCKNCRAEWMEVIKDWFNKPIIVTESCGSGIFIREYGSVREITKEEWNQRNFGREPIRYFKEDKDQE